MPAEGGSGGVPTVKAEYPCSNDGFGLGTTPLNHHTMRMKVVEYYISKIPEVVSMMA